MKVTQAGHPSPGKAPNPDPGVRPSFPEMAMPELSGNKKGKRKRDMKFWERNCNHVKAWSRSQREQNCAYLAPVSQGKKI